MDQIGSQLKWIDAQQRAMLTLLQEWCAINSGSTHLEGLKRMLKQLASRFTSLGGNMQCIDLPHGTSIDERGHPVAFLNAQALHISKRPEAAVRVFLGGHMDTVYGKDHPFQKRNYFKGIFCADQALLT